MPLSSVRHDDEVVELRCAARAMNPASGMQLRIARLCLDCDELHDEAHCPVCASEAFAYLTRWVPAPERRMRPRETTSPDAEVFKGLLDPSPQVPTPTALAARSPTRLPWKRGIVGLTMLGVAGWLWQTGRTSSAAGAGAGATRKQNGPPPPPPAQGDDAGGPD